MKNKTLYFIIVLAALIYRYLFRLRNETCKFLRLWISAISPFLETSKFRLVLTNAIHTYTQFNKSDQIAN